MLIASMALAAMINASFATDRPRFIERASRSWVLVSGSNLTGVYVTEQDIASVKSGDYQYWGMLDHQSNSSVPYRYTLNRYTEHCGSMQYSISLSVNYMANGTVHSQSDLGIYRDLIVPGTIAEGRHLAVCFQQ